MGSSPQDPMPVFVLKGKDALAPGTIAYYGRECGKHHGLHEQAEQVELAYQEMAGWQRRNPDLVALPDHKHVPVTASDCPQPGDTVSLASRLLFDAGSREGTVVAVADDGLVSVEFPQPGSPYPMTVTAPADQFTMVHRFDADTVVREAEARGYARAVEALRDAANRTGSPAARWAADYLEVTDVQGDVRCPNCAPGYDCAHGVYTPAESEGGAGDE